MQYHFLARFHVRAGQEDRAQAALAELGLATREEPGCLDWYGFRLLKDPSCFIVSSRWPDRAAFDVHASLAHTEKFIAFMNTLVDQEPSYEGGLAVVKPPQ